MPVFYRVLGNFGKRAAGMKCIWGLKSPRRGGEGGARRELSPKEETAMNFRGCSPYFRLRASIYNNRAESVYDVCHTLRVMNVMSLTPGERPSPAFATMWGRECRIRDRKSRI